MGVGGCSAEVGCFDREEERFASLSLLCVCVRERERERECVLDLGEGAGTVISFQVRILRPALVRSLLWPAAGRHCVSAATDRSG